jgi:hypothetical protein
MGRSTYHREEKKKTGQPNRRKPTGYPEEKKMIGHLNRRGTTGPPEEKRMPGRPAHMDEIVDTPVPLMRTVMSKHLRILLGTRVRVQQDTPGSGATPPGETNPELVLSVVRKDILRQTALRGPTTKIL